MFADMADRFRIDSDVEEALWFTGWISSSACLQKPHRTFEQKRRDRTFLMRSGSENRYVQHKKSCFESQPCIHWRRQQSLLRDAQRSSTDQAALNQSDI